MVERGLVTSTRPVSEVLPGQCHQVIIQYLSKSMNKENKSI
jgi:hypothetical protein